MGAADTIREAILEALRRNKIKLIKLGDPMGNSSMVHWDIIGQAHFLKELLGTNVAMQLYIEEQNALADVLFGRPITKVFRLVMIFKDKYSIDKYKSTIDYLNLKGRCKPVIIEDDCTYLTYTKRIDSPDSIKENILDLFDFTIKNYIDCLNGEFYQRNF